MIKVLLRLYPLNRFHFLNKKRNNLQRYSVWWRHSDFISDLVGHEKQKVGHHCIK